MEIQSPFYNDVTPEIWEKLYANPNFIVLATDRFVTKEVAARLINASPSTIKNRIDTGEYKSYYVASIGKELVDLWTIKEYIAKEHSNMCLDKEFLMCNSAQVGPIFSKMLAFYLNQHTSDDYEVAQAMKKVEEMSEQFSVLKADFKKANTEKDSLDKELTKEQALKHELREGLQNAENRLAEETESRQNAELELKTKSEELDKEKIHAKKLEKSLSDANTDLKVANNQIENLEKQLAEAKKVAEDNKLTNEKLREFMENFRSQKSENETVKA